MLLYVVRDVHVSSWYLKKKILYWYCEEQKGVRDQEEKNNKYKNFL